MLLTDKQTNKRYRKHNLIVGDNIQQYHYIITLYIMSITGAGFNPWEVYDLYIKGYTIITN